MPASPRLLRRRIRSIRNTAKITKAMQLIAASKMRRAQQMMFDGRPYAEKIREVLSRLAAIQTIGGQPAVPLLEVRPTTTTALVLVTPDRGLCGALVANVNRAAARTLAETEGDVLVIAVGRRGRNFMVRVGAEVKAVFDNIPDRPKLSDTLPISALVISLFEKHQLDKVLLGYSRFDSVAVQHPVIQNLVPIEPAELGPHELIDYIYEPDPETVLTALLPRYIEMQVYHAILEAIASEHSARMVAMKNATDAANEMIDDLTLALNKARQEAITAEMLDIVGAVAALES